MGTLLAGFLLEGFKKEGMREQSWEKQANLEASRVRRDFRDQNCKGTGLERH